MTSTPGSGRTSAVGVAVALVAAATACTGDSAGEPTPSPESSSAPILQVRPGPLTVRLTPPVRGQLAPGSRNNLRASLRRALGSWMSSGFGAGTDSSDAFVAYTPGAAGLARRQAAVTTTTRLEPELVETVPTRRQARVSVLAAGGRAVGASADVVLVVVGAHADGSSIEVVVRGDLELTPTSDGWKVFGFELARSQGPPGTYAAAVRRQREREARRDRDEPGERRGSSR